MRSSSKKAGGGTRFFSALMAIVLAIGLMPLPAFAATEAPQGGLSPALPAQGDTASDSSGDKGVNNSSSDAGKQGERANGAKSSLRGEQDGGLICNSVSIPAGIPTQNDKGQDVVYMSISDNGAYITSDGENSGITMANVAIPISEVAKIKLSDYGLEDYTYQVDGTDQVTVLHLYLYVLKNYYSGGTDSLAVNGGAGSLYITSFWGFDPGENFTYYANGEYPLQYSGWGATADQMILRPGIHVDLTHFTDMGFWMDSNAGHGYFYDTSKSASREAITLAYSGNAGEAISLGVLRAGAKMSTGNDSDYGTGYYTAAGQDVYYATSYKANNATKLGTTDENGKVSATITEPGTYYVWTDGQKGSDNPDVVVSGPAMATVTVKDSNAAPALAEGVSATAEASVAMGEAYTLDLSTIFSDANNDELTYKVAINDAEAVAADASYSYTPEGAGTTTLKFTANDGKVDSTDTYTVTLTATYEVITEGTTTEFVAGSDSSIVFKSSAPAEKFDNFVFDGNTLTKDTDYTVTSGSTVITLSNDFAATLTPGEHTWAMNYTDGAQVTGTLNVKEGTDPTTLWNQTRSWVARSYALCDITKVEVAGVSVKSAEWTDGATCNVVLVPSTKKEASFKLNISKSGVSSGGVRINGSGTTASSISYEVELSGGAASVTLQPYYSNNTGTLKTINFSIEGGGQETLWNVSLPTGTGYTVTPVSESASPVANKGNFTFKFAFEEGYKAGADFVIKVNGEAVELDENGQYTISNIKGDKVVTVEDVVTSDTVNKYRITLTEADGVTYASVDDSASPVDEGNAYKFTVSLATGYMAGSSFAVNDNGTAMTADENGVYTLSNVNAHHTITVTGVVHLASVTAPTGSTVQAGPAGSWSYTFNDPVFTTDNGDGSTTYWFNPMSGTTFYRVQHPDAVTYWDFQSMTAGSAYTVTMNDMTKDGTFAKGTIYHDFYYNYLDLGDVYLTANAQCYLPMAQGSSKVLNAFRNWQAIESFTNAKIAVPDVHYEVVDIEGNPSDLVSVEADKNNSGYSHIKASSSKTGMAIIKVTYDAMIHKQGYASGYGAGGADSTRLGAIWPECTGVIVVTVGQDGSAIPMGMTINTDKPIAHAGKVAGDNIDAEHDLLYYYGDEGATYTFKPAAGSTVSIARCTLNEKSLSFSGFTTDGVATDDEGNVTLTGLTAGRHIVKVEKDGLANYQVVSARQITVVANDSTGTEINGWDSHIFAPGDELTLTLHNVNSPQEKLTNCYNNSFSVAYFGEDAPTTRLASTNDGTHGYGQYNFSSMDQVITVKIPSDWTSKKTYTIGDGAVAMAGFSGGAAGCHRAKSFGDATGMAQGTAGAGILADLPDITLNVDAAPHVIEGLTNPATAAVATGEAYELDLSKVFVDDNGDALTYKVAINDAEAVDAEEDYGIVFDEAGVYTLVFTANDGVVDSSNAYTVQLKVDQENNAPALKEGVEATDTKTLVLGGSYAVDLNQIFEDQDNDNLSYKVAINGADPVAAPANYAYEVTTPGTKELVFTANDGAVDSADTFTVTINVLVGSDTGTYWDYNVDGNGWVGRTNAYCYVQTVSSSGVSVKGFEWTDATTCDVELLPTTAQDAMFDFTVTNYQRSSGTNGVRINGTAYNGSTRTVVISLENGVAAVTVQPYGYNQTTASYQGTTKTFNFRVAENSAPALAEGVDATAAADLLLGESYTTNLGFIFADEDGDALTYKVAVDDVDAVAADANYSYKPETAGTHKLVFTANDGAVDSSDTYTVTLKVFGENTAPKLAEGVAATNDVSVAEGDAYEVDLSTIFADAENNELTYKVAVDGREAVNAAKDYRFKPRTAASHTLVFTANDGWADSTDTYTVNISVPITVAETVADATAGSEYDGGLTITGFVDNPTVYTVGGFDVPGLTLAENGAISGTPTEAGEYVFKVLANDGDRYSKVTQVTLKVLDAPAITTESLPSVLVGQEYEATIEASGYSGSYKFSLAAGSVLPEGVTLSEDGKISGTFAEKGKVTFTVEATAPDGQKASKELSIIAKTKYRQAEGTVYLTVTSDGEYIVSSGTISGVPVRYLPIDLAQLSKYDLDERGFGEFNYKARSADADYEYEVTLLHLFLYANEYYSASGLEGLGVSGGPGGIYFYSGFMGHPTENLLYNLNGIRWNDPDMYSQWYVTQSTADHMPLYDGYFADVAAFSSYSIWASHHLFTTISDEPTEPMVPEPGYGDVNGKGNATHDYGTQVAGEPFDVRVINESSNWQDGKTNWNPIVGKEVQWGTVFGKAEGSATTGDNGIASVTIYAPGTYYLWSVEEYDLPAYATVKVEGELVEKAPEFRTESLPYAMSGEEYSATIEAIGSPSDIAFSVKAGSLPEGLTLAEDGTISGTLAAGAGGLYEVSVVAFNDAGLTTKKFELAVFDPIEFVTTQDEIPQAIAGQEYGPIQIQAKGKGPEGAEVVFGGGSMGMGLRCMNGVIQGNAQERYIGRTWNANAVAYYRYNDETVGSVRQAYAVTIVGEPAITTESIPDSFVGQPYDVQLEGTGGGLKWEVVDGALPGNNNSILDASTGKIYRDRINVSGGGLRSVTIKASNAAGSDEKTYTYYQRVREGAISTESLANAGEGASYEQALELSLSDALAQEDVANGHEWSISSGALPEGLSIDAQTGVISGTPAAGTQGSYNFTVKHQIINSSARIKDFTLVVEPSLSIATESVPAIFVGQSDYSFQFEAAGFGSDSVTWSVETSSVGNQYLNLSESGLLTSKSARTGTASIAPNYFKVTATAADGTSVTKGFRVAWKYKYQQVNGTHYVSFSVDDEFATSDGATAGKVMWHQPVTKAELVAVDLDAVGLGDYKSTPPVDANGVSALSSDNTQSWVYPMNGLNLLVAANNKYSADPEVQVGASWIKKAFGKTGSAQFTFLVNGVYPMQEGSTTTGAMINEVPVTGSTSLDLAYFTDPNFSTDFNNGQKTFVDDSGKVLYNKTGVFAGDETPLQLQLTGIDWTVGGGTAGTVWPAPDYVSKSGITVAYGKVYGTPEGTVETGDNGVATITFPETEGATSAVTWYVWSPGDEGVMGLADVANSPAMVTVQVTNKAAAQITTASIANQRINSPMNVTLAASGQPKTFTWSLGEGSSLPQGVELTEAGKLTGTPTEKGEFTFTAIASNGVGDPASKEFTFTVGDKYKQLEGTAYLTLCYLDKFEMSTANGTEKTAGVPIAHLPIDLADASQWDAEAHGLPSGANGSVNAEGSYDLTAVRLIGYVAEKYYDAENPAAGIQGTSYVTGAWGHDTGNIIYEVNGVSPMVGIGDWKVQDGEVVCLYNCTNWSAWGDPYYGFHYFLSEANTTGFDKDKITYRYEGEVNKPVEVYFSREAGGVMSSSTANDAAGYTLYYGRSYNDAAGFVTCDENGTAQITFDEPGEWVIWADGGKGQSLDDFVSSAAIAWASVSGTPVVKTIELPDATAMTEYNAQLEAYGGDESTTWFVEDSSKLPAGISVAEDGTVSGIATTPDAYEFTVYAMSEAGVSEAATVKITVVGEAPAITTAELAEAAVGTEYSAAIETTGTPAPAITVEGLPEGLAFNAETGAIEGTPTQGGEFNVVVKASNGLAPDAEATLKLVVKADPVFVTESLPAGFVDVDYEAQIEVTAYPQPTLLVTGLPAGLSFDKETNKITGVPTEEGSSAVKVIAVGGTKNVSMEYLLTITSVDDTLFNNAKDAAEQKIEAAGTALEAAKTAAESAQAAAQAVDAAADPAAKAEAAQASVDAAQAAVDKAAEAADAADQALAAAQTAQAAAVTNTQKATAEELVSQAQAAKDAADEAKTAANAAKTAADEAKAVADAAKAVADADKTVAETGSAAEAAKAAADAVNAATDPAAKAEAAQAAVDAAQAAVDKAAAAVEAAQAAVEAAQSAKDAATSDEQKAAAEALLAQAQAARDAANAAKTAADEGKIAADAAKAAADAAKAAADKASKVEAGKTYQVGGMSYKVTKVASGNANGAVTLTKAKDAKNVSVPAAIKLADGKSYAVDTIATKAFSKLKKLKKATVGANIKKIEKSAFFKTPKLKKLVVKSNQLKAKSSVKGALKGSKAKKLKVKVPKKLKKAYKKSFKKSNLKAPKKVTVK